MSTLETLIDQEIEIHGADGTEEEVLGTLIARYFDHDPVAIVETAAFALDRTGHHRDACEQLWMLAGKVKYQRRHP